MLHTIIDRLDVSVEHGAVGANAKRMRSAMYADVVGTAEFLVGNLLAHGSTERFRTTAGHGVEARFAQRAQHIGPAHLLYARDVRDLDGRERLDVHVRKVRLEGAEHPGEVLDTCFHIESAN